MNGIRLNSVKNYYCWSGTSSAVSDPRNGSIGSRGCPVKSVWFLAGWILPSPVDEQDRLRSTKGKGLREPGKVAIECS